MHPIIVSRTLIIFCSVICNSINKKLEEFKDFLFKFNPDIVLLNETKLNDFIDNVSFSVLVNYDYLHKQRSSKNGSGGGFILIKKEIKFEIINIFDSLNLEILSIKIHKNKKDIKLHHIIILRIFNFQRKYLILYLTKNRFYHNRRSIC